MNRSKNPVFNLLFILSAFLVLNFHCKKDEPSIPAISDEQLQAIKTCYRDIAPGLDSAILKDDPYTAFKSMLSAIQAKDAVDEAWMDSTSLYVKFDHGGVMMWSITPEPGPPIKSAAVPGKFRKNLAGNPLLVGNKDVLLLDQQ